MTATEITDIVCDFGRKYVKEYLSATFLKEMHKINIERIEIDWWEALKFFFSKVLFQGRRDEVSMRVYNKVIELLGKWFDKPDKDKEFDRLASEEWREIEYELSKYISPQARRFGNKPIGKRGDIRLVKDALKFISRIRDKNVVMYAIRRIREGKLRELFTELINISFVGQKTASFFLRDLVFLFELEKYINEEDIMFLQPIDTWVRKVAADILKLTGIRDDELKREIVKRLGRKSIWFNAGAWYIGSNSYRVVIALLQGPEKDALESLAKR